MTDTAKPKDVDWFLSQIKPENKVSNLVRDCLMDVDLILQRYSDPTASLDLLMRAMVGIGIPGDFTIKNNSGNPGLEFFALGLIRPLRNCDMKLLTSDAKDWLQDRRNTFAELICNRWSDVVPYINGTKPHPSPPDGTICEALINLFSVMSNLEGCEKRMLPLLIGAREQLGNATLAETAYPYTKQYVLKHLNDRIEVVENNLRSQPDQVIEVIEAPLKSDRQEPRGH